MRVLSLLMALTCLSGVMASTTGCTPKAKNDSPNTFRMPSVSKIKGLDPIYADDQYSGIEVSRAYEGLLQYHYLKRPYVLVPDLAEAMPEVSADGKTYTFRLKKGVLFQDDPCFKETGGKGRELTAEDFIYSFKRLADPKLLSTGWWLLEGKIAGLDEWRKAGANVPDYGKPVEGLRAPDRYTLQITLKQRSAQFIYALSMPFTAVVPREAVEAYGREFMNHAVGTGPFRLAEYDRNSKLVWVKNPTYRKELYPAEGEAGDKEAGLLEDAGKPIPFVDKVVVQIFEESQPMWLTFLQGKLDVTGIPKDNYDQAIAVDKDLSPELKAKEIQLKKMINLDVTHYTFNMADPVVGGTGARSRYLRQALSLAFDGEKYIELFHNGRATAAQGPIPPGIAGYDPEFKNPYRQYNVTKAKELLAKAGYPEGKGLPPIEYLTQSDSTSRQSTEYLQKMFAAIGVQLKVNTFSFPEMQTAIRNRKGQLWGYAWSADYPDAENFLQQFYSKNVSPGPNDSHYSNPEFDKLYEKALLLPDSPERTALYKQMAQLVVEDCPWIFGVHRVAFTLIQPWLKNYKRHAFMHAAPKYYRLKR